MKGSTCTQRHRGSIVSTDQITVQNVNKQQSKGEQEANGGRFKQVCRSVILMLKVCKGMVNYAQTGILDYESIKLNIQTTEGGLAFDKDRYCRKKEFRWPAVYLEIIEKPSASRSHVDILALQKMMRCLRSFRKFNFETQREICRYIKYERYTRNRMIIREGHQPQGVYFVFSGTIAENFSDKTGTSLPEIRFYQRGDIFGITDIALDQVRSSTLVCDGFTEVLFLDLDDIYHTGLVEDLKSETFNIKDHLSNKSDLSSLPEASINRLISSSCLLDMDDQKIIDIWSRTPKWVYVVYKGSCDVVKKSYIADLPQKLKQKLQSFLVGSDSTRATCSLKTLDQFEEEELTDRQKLLRFIDSVDNNISSRVISSWSPKRPELYHRLGSPDSEILGQVTCGPKDNVNTGYSPPPSRESQNNNTTSESSSFHQFPSPSKRTTLPHYLSFTLRHLEPGTVFGSAFLCKENKNIFFLSKGCTLIAIPSSVFMLTSTDSITLDICKTHSATPSGYDLCLKYAKYLAWKHFKNTFIDSLFCGNIEDSVTSSRSRNAKPYYTRNVTIPSRACQEQGYRDKCIAYTPEGRKARTDAISRVSSRPKTVIPLAQTSSFRKGSRGDQVIKSAPPCLRTKPEAPSGVRSTRFTASTSKCQMRQSLTGVRHVLQLLPDKI